MAKVLVVDDDRNTVRLLHTLLELDGFDVVSALRGSDVMPAMEAHHPDIVLMDYHLTDMDGIEVVKMLRAMPAYAHIPIVMASGLDVEYEALEAGASCFLAKPYEPPELPRVFNELLGL